MSVLECDERLIYCSSYTVAQCVFEDFFCWSVHWYYLCKLCITGKQSWKFYKKYPVSKVLYTELFDAG